MKHLKRINEFFDTEDLKSEMEIDYLQGSIPFKDMVKDSSIRKQKDLLLSKLFLNCPFIKELEYTRVNDNLLQIGFKKQTEDGISLYYVIEVMEHKSAQKYLGNVYAYASVDDDVIFSEKINLPLMNYNGLVRNLNSKALDLLILFNKFTNSRLKYQYNSISKRSDVGNIGYDGN